jgi:hypothetical protein
MRQIRWPEFLKDYDFELNYHPGKANVVADALSRKTLHMSALMAREIKLIGEFRDLSLVCRVTPNSLKWGMLKVTNNVLEEIKEGQRTDPELVKQQELINQGRGVDFKVDKDGITRFTSGFWRSLQQALGTQLKWSSAYHPQTDGQTERTIQSLEDLLRACVLDQVGVGIVACLLSSSPIITLIILASRWHR